MPKTCTADSARAIIGPMSVLGNLSVPEQQILFNRFREQLNQRYHLVSHKVLELIAERGIKSIDIEDCTSSKCVREVLSFTKNLHHQFKTDELFLFQLVRNETETQMSLKLSSLSIPEITEKIVTRTCHKCDTETLIRHVDKLVQKMLENLPLEKVALPEKDIVPTEKEVALPEKDIAPTEKEVASPEKFSSPEPVELLDLAEKQIPEPPAPDPYIVARESYNQRIGQLLLDVTYALQIFRSGMFVQLEVSIDESGTVTDIIIKTTSGSQDFDETAIMALEDIQFDPLPEAMLKYGNYVVILQIQNSR
ncbi:MAG: TonB family protein [SAR324 cluster bacterium]|nr:TonB family protein [SAR324 cluster bacterium]